MTLPLPKWLTSAYTDLTVSFGYLPFTVDEAKRVLKKDAAALLLSRLKRYGWLDYVQRETYRIVHPLVCLLEVSGMNWRSRVSQKERLPIIELVAARVMEELDGRLVSLLLFGSLARGEARPESDIDILLVAEGLPESYGRRLELVRSLTSLDQARRWREYLWNKRRVYPLLEVIALTPDEARITHPFYLDMVEDRIAIYDRGRFMEGRLEELKSRLAEIGASKVTLPSGKSYWSLAKNEKDARELVI